MNDTIDICRIEGKIIIDNEDIYSKEIDPVLLRAKVGMVFQKTQSIFQNQFLKMLPTVQEFMGLLRVMMSSMN